MYINGIVAAGYKLISTWVLGPPKFQVRDQRQIGTQRRGPNY